MAPCPDKETIIIPNFAIGTIYRRIICNKEMQSKFGITPACTKNLVEIFRPALRAKNAIAFFGIIYAEGRLSKKEAQELERHLVVCAKCKEMAEITRRRKEF